MFNVLDKDVVGFKRSLRFLECEEIKTPFVGELKDKCDFILRLSLRSCLYMLSLWERIVRREVFMAVMFDRVLFYTDNSVFEHLHKQNNETR